MSCNASKYTTMKQDKAIEKVNWNRSKITARAWELHKGGETWAAAMATAWHEQKVNALLYLLPRCLEVHFEFMKKNGKRRVARGTTFQPAMAIHNATPQGFIGNHNPETNKPFVDVDKAENGEFRKWSSLILANLETVTGYIWPH